MSDYPTPADLARQTGYGEDDWQHAKNTLGDLWPMFWRTTAEVATRTGRTPTEAAAALHDLATRR